MNRITITGKLTKDPEYQQHGNVNVVRFSLHHSRNSGKDQQGNINWVTEFFDLELKGFPNSNNNRPDMAAAFMQRGLKKGDMLWVEASQETREYKDNQGQDKKFKNFVVEHYEVLIAKPSQNPQQPQYAQQPQQPQYQPAQPQYAPAPPQPQAPNYAPRPAQTTYAPPATQPQYAPPAPPPQPNYTPPPPVPGYAPAPPQQQFQPPAPAPGQQPQPGQPGPPPQFNGGQSAPF